MESGKFKKNSIYSNVKFTDEFALIYGSPETLMTHQKSRGPMVPSAIPQFDTFSRLQKIS